ncbi:hypothetical protein IKX64_01175 [Candidatus Saccharibacteria bacterium]|nr:hypothetical protein [Candidatus Saccharibacteria bacterium]
MDINVDNYWDGVNIDVKKDGIYIDGKKVPHFFVDESTRFVVIGGTHTIHVEDVERFEISGNVNGEITVTNGDLAVVGDVTGNIKSSGGYVCCKDVSGNVETSGHVVGGNTIGGNVSCDAIVL